jgi:hypothetical protein
VRRRARAERDELDLPLAGSNQPRWPLRCAENQTPPSGPGATSWMPVRWRVPSGQLRAAAVSLRAAPGQLSAPAPRARKREGLAAR